MMRRLCWRGGAAIRRKRHRFGRRHRRTHGGILLARGLGGLGRRFGVLEALLHVERRLDTVDFDGEGATGCAVGGEPLVVEVADFFE